MSRRNFGTDWTPSRRDVLGAMGAAGAVSLSGCGILDGDGEDEDGEDSVTLGVSVPEGGRLSDEGAELLDGFRLAVEQINAGSGAFDAGPWTGTIGEGILGREVELAVQDTDSSPDGAADSAETLVNEGADVILGGASAREGAAIQSVAGREEVLHLGGFTPDDNLGGLDCSRYAFQEMYNPTMAAEALAPVLASELGAEESITFAQMYPDSDVGTRMSLAFRSRFEDVGWSHNRRDRTRVGTRDFVDVAESVVGSGADMFVLNYSGLAAANAIRDLVDVADDDVTIVVPFLNRQALENAGSALEGVIGTLPWTPALDDEFSQQFRTGWQPTDTDATVPSELSYLAYVQTCQFAAAAERAGSLEADALVDALEGYEYDLGMGAQELRACDHLAEREIAVVRGTPQSQEEPGDYTELLEISEGATYPCDAAPAANCDL